VGKEGIDESIRGTLVLDAGALIGLERGDATVAVTVEEADRLGVEVMVPASALAQAWRGGARSARLSRLIGGCEVDSLDDGRAKEVGVRLGARGGKDIADSHVVCCAVAHRGVIATSDRADMSRLVAPGEAVRLIDV
jgi:hypothetical protein